MLGGNTEVLCKLEEQLAKFYDKEAALVVSSGFLAAMSVSPALAGKND